MGGAGYSGEIENITYIFLRALQILLAFLYLLRYNVIYTLIKFANIIGVFL